VSRTKATIKAEFDPGASIHDDFTEAIRLAKLLNVWIEFKFNDITCLCNGESELKECIESYNLAIKYNTKFAIA